MQQVPLKQKVARCLPFLQKAGLVADPPPCDTAPYLSQILTAAGDRVKVAGDVLDYSEFHQGDDAFKYDAATLEKRLAKPPEAAALLGAFSTELATAEPFDAPTLEKLLHAFVEQRGVKIGDVVHAIRVAVTGKPVGFGLFDVLAILGRERCRNRIERALATVSSA